MKFRDKSKRKVNINITSLIDVLFLLLIFFIVSSRFIEQPAMKLQLPETTMKKRTEEKGYTLFITKDGSLYINEQKVDNTSLLARLQEIAPEIKKRGLIIKADETVDYGVVIRAMDTAKNSGITKLIVATREKMEKK
ncbi:MAG: biopolymer transporter ExbD [bacterium]